MSTPYTLMRCRMKDLISCFKACKVPIEDDDTESNSQNPKPPSTNHQNRQRDKRVLEGGGGGGGGGGVEGEESPTSWQSCESEEDEYIVFYFRGDDARVDVIEERGLENSTLRKPAAIPADHRKSQKHETRKIEVDSKSIPSTTKDMNEWSEPELHEQETLGESSDSSSSSFAFPTIQSEWPGSPVLMPRPEGHNKTRRVCIQCCKF